MNVYEFLKENKSRMSLGIPIELQDLIDERTVYAGSYESMMEGLEMVGLQHVRNARFVVEDRSNEQNKIVLLYMKDLDKYDDFDLRQFAYKMKRLESIEQAQAGVDEVLQDAAQRAGKETARENSKELER